MVRFELKHGKPTWKGTGRGRGWGGIFSFFSRWHAPRTSSEESRAHSLFSAPSSTTPSPTPHDVDRTNSSCLLSRCLILPLSTPGPSLPFPASLVPQETRPFRSNHLGPQAGSTGHRAQGAGRDERDCVPPPRPGRAGRVRDSAPCPLPLQLLPGSRSHSISFPLTLVMG